MRFRIEDKSMEPSLKTGDYVIVNRWAYFFSKPKARDIVVFADPNEKKKFLVKRIEKVDNQQVFVVGDNKELSKDSREFGPIELSSIFGKVWIRFG